MLDRLRARIARRMLRLALLAGGLDAQRAPAPDLSETADVELPFGRLYLPAADQFITPTLLEHREWEPAETQLVRDGLRPGATFVDVGAHVGYFSCLAATMVGPRGLVVAFEPHPRNYELLLANAWRNGLNNIVAFPWAVSDVNGFAELFVSASNTGGHQIQPSPDEDRDVVGVRTVALDRLDVIRPPLDFVKVDTQGFDDLVLRGMGGLLQQSPNATVLVEFWPYGIVSRGAEPRDVLAYLRSLGRPVRVVRSDVAADLEDRSDDEILERCGPDGRLHVNLVLSP